jgi:hypothetical protein
MYRTPSCALQSSLQVLPLPWVEATPDAAGLVGDDRVGQALQADYAGAADGSGLIGSLIARREEEFGVRPCAVAAGAPASPGVSGGLGEQGGWKVFVVC